MNCPLAYAIGFHLCEDAAEDRPFVEEATELFAREEEGLVAAARSRPRPGLWRRDPGDRAGQAGLAGDRRGHRLQGVAPSRSAGAEGGGDVVWPRRRFGPLVRGADGHEAEGTFPEWEITDVEPSRFPLPKPLELMLNPDELWYRLTRR